MALREPTPKELVTDEYFGDMIRVVQEEPPLPLVLVFTAALEKALMTLLDAFFIESRTSKNLFDIKGDLESFSKCFRLAFCLGLISEASFGNLKTIAKIRNLFAHETKVPDFTHPGVAKECSNLTLAPMVLPDRIMATMSASHDPAEVNRNRFIYVCLPMLKFVLDAANMIERRKEIDESPLWANIAEKYRQADQQYQALITQPIPAHQTGTLEPWPDQTESLSVGHQLPGQEPWLLFRYGQ